MRVHRIEWAAEGTIIIDLRNPDGSPVTPFTAGAHIELLMPSIGITRAYSLANDPAETHRYVLGVVLEPKSRGGSRFLHRELRVGDTIDVQGPHNHFPLDDTNDHSVLIAGGIGVTPILTMAHRLKAMGKSFEFHFAVRDLSRAAFLDEVKAVCGDRLHLHIDAEVGRPLNIPGIVAKAPAHSHFYCCGPLPMLHAYEEATKDLPDDNVHLEYFKAPPPAVGGGAFEVEIASTGEVFTIPPEKTILEVLSDAGAYFGSSCAEGVCGSCECKVLKGEPDHRDSVLTARQKATNKVMMICVSRAKSERLLIDVD
ncbi:PDR/VanB family oxidoreductase [Oryzibacter oryziterrae]|uniref:PDR/VanB family oxidoreductase n=1 Tax=Oryzibacter oryziterrae TaxID=2766474 RepID=UPI001F3F70FF|nr:PDR/VanB family oxidoreductase [Oryzibacter oryziterrae]